jgi:hypothetical protein
VVSQWLQASCFVVGGAVGQAAVQNTNELFASFRRAVLPADLHAPVHFDSYQVNFDSYINDSAVYFL